MKIISIVGARPQFIKAATLSRAIRKRDDIQELIVHTGQHYDKKMSDAFFTELQIPEPAYNLEVGSASHGKQTAAMLEKIENVLINESPNWVITFGDTNSTVAGALAATKLHIPTAHVEAGLRSFNRKMPEEINRIATDHISDLLFAPTRSALDLLASEGLSEKGRFTGDVMYDSILFYKELVNDEHLPVNMEKEQYYLSTIHRPENTDNIDRLQNIFSAFTQLDYPVILPLHPRTRNHIKQIHFNDNVKIIDPVGYLDIIALLKNCRKVLTDSGGLQKEAYFMQKPCITLRDQTEWVETIANNWNFVLADRTDEILEKIKINDFGPQTDDYGDGTAAELIVENILGYSKG